MKPSLIPGSSRRSLRDMSFPPAPHLLSLKKKKILPRVHCSCDSCRARRGGGVLRAWQRLPPAITQVNNMSAMPHHKTRRATFLLTHTHPPKIPVFHLSVPLKCAGCSVGPTDTEEWTMAWHLCSYHFGGFPLIDFFKIFFLFNILFYIPRSSDILTIEEIWSILSATWYPGLIVITEYQGFPQEHSLWKNPDIIPNGRDNDDLLGFGGHGVRLAALRLCEVESITRSAIVKIPPASRQGRI